MTDAPSHKRTSELDDAGALEGSERLSLIKWSDEKGKWENVMTTVEDVVKLAVWAAPTVKPVAVPHPLSLAIASLGGAAAFELLTLLLGLLHHG